MLKKVHDTDLIEELLARGKEPGEIYKAAKRRARLNQETPARKCWRIMSEILDQHSTQHPDQRLGPYRLAKLAKQSLLKQGIKVGSAEHNDRGCGKDLDETTVRNYAKSWCIFYGNLGKKFDDLSIDDWRWLSKHEFGTKALKLKFRNMILSFIEKEQELKRLILQVRENQERMHHAKKELHDLKVKSGEIPPSAYQPADYVPHDELAQAESKLAYWNEVLKFFPSQSK